MKYNNTKTFLIIKIIWMTVCKLMLLTVKLSKEAHTGVAVHRPKLSAFVKLS